MVAVKDKGPQDYVLSDNTGKIGDSDLSGNGEIALGGTRPSLKFDLASKSTNLVPLLDMKGGDSKPATGGGGSGGNAAGGGNGGRLFSDDPLPLDGLKDRKSTRLNSSH